MYNTRFKNTSIVSAQDMCNSHVLLHKCHEMCKNISVVLTAIRVLPRYMSYTKTVILNYDN